jgi:hypothetical protein
MSCLTDAPAMEESWCASAGSTPEGLFRKSGRQRSGNVIAVRMSGDVHIVGEGKDLAAQRPCTILIVSLYSMFYHVHKVVTRKWVFDGDRCREAQ